MPGESGLVLVEEIARDHPRTAIVMVTGVDDPEIAEQAFRLGAHGYLVKPFWPGQLQITVANALRQHRLELAEEARNAALLGSADEKAEALRHELIEAQRKAIADLRASRQETVERLARAIEMHDPETGRHIDRMAADRRAARSEARTRFGAGAAAARGGADARHRQDRHPRQRPAQAGRPDRRASASGWRPTPRSGTGSSPTPKASC